MDHMFIFFFFYKIVVVSSFLNQKKADVREKED